MVSRVFHDSVARLIGVNSGICSICKIRVRLPETISQVRGFHEKKVSSNLFVVCAHLFESGSVAAIGPPPTVDSVQLGLPISSIDGEGSLDGSSFSGILER